MRNLKYIDTGRIEFNPKFYINYEEFKAFLAVHTGLRVGELFYINYEEFKVARMGKLRSS